MNGCQVLLGRFGQDFVNLCANAGGLGFCDLGAFKKPINLLAKDIMGKQAPWCVVWVFTSSSNIIALLAKDIMSWFIN